MVDFHTKEILEQQGFYHKVSQSPHTDHTQSNQGTKTSNGHHGDEEFKSALSCPINISYPEQTGEIPCGKMISNGIWSSGSEKSKMYEKKNLILQLKNSDVQMYFQTKTC